MKIAEQFKCPNNELFISAVAMLIVFLAVELLFRVYDLYRIFPPVDIISHLLSGMTVTTGAFWVASLTKIKKKMTTALTVTLMVGIIWEILEMIDDRVTYNSPYLIDNFFWDGVLDIAMMIVGGILALRLIAFLKNKTKLLG